MITKLELNSFRLFNDQEFFLGKYVTVFSGMNATGKSTLLGLLGNSCELKVGKGKPLIGNQYRAEFSELFKADREFDPSGSNKCCVKLERKNGDEEQRSFRISWQDGGKRFRLIPKGFNSDGKETEAKMSYPVLYLGLSRLFPAGEAMDDGIKRESIRWADDEDKQWYLDNYRLILSITDSIVGVDSYHIAETSHKHGVGISTESYGALANSVGQDNLGQILLALLSFRVLKRDHPDLWDGGLLLVDELDATLHPVAQIRLFELIMKNCRELDMQVAFTTHSLSLLEEICNKVLHNEGNRRNAVELYALSTGNGFLEVKRNPSFLSMKNSLMSMSFAHNKVSVKVFTEDAEARWLINGLLSDEPLFSCVRMLDVNNGCEFIMKMYREDYPYFKEAVVVFDGDVKESEIEEKIPKSLRDSAKNIVKLPGKVRPETLIYELLFDLDGTDDFWQRASQYDFNKTTLVERGPKSSQYSNLSEERERFKQWFKDTSFIFEQADVIEVFKRKHPRWTEKFIKEFRAAYNAVARRIGAQEFTAFS